MTGRDAVDKMLATPTERVEVARTRRSKWWRATSLVFALGTGAGCAADSPRTVAPLRREHPRTVTRSSAIDVAASRAIRHAVRWGAPADYSHSLDIVEGNLVRVDVATGEVTVVAPGLAVGWRCAATRLPSDVVFTCGPDPEFAGVDVNGSSPAWGGLVISHTLERPTVEMTSSHASFEVSDDGGVVVHGLIVPGARSPSCPPLSARALHDGHQLWPICARDVDGRWRTWAVDAGDGTRFVYVRTVPRGDGDAGLVVRDIDGDRDAWGLYDARTGELHRWVRGPGSAEAEAALAHGDDGWAQPCTDSSNPSPATDQCNDGAEPLCVDRGWSLTGAGTLVGWARVAGSLGRVDILSDGTVLAARQRFGQLARAGQVAIGRAEDGNWLETVDHGGTWVAVVLPDETLPGRGPPPPPLGWPHCAFPVCSLVGCDLDAWFRIGW